MNVDGYALASAIESYHSAAADIGSITAIGEAEGRIDDDQIIVYVQVEGEKKDAEAEEGRNRREAPGLRHRTLIRSSGYIMITALWAARISKSPKSRKRRKSPEGARACWRLS